MSNTGALLREACEKLGVRSVRPLRDGGQKLVREVLRGFTERLVLKLVILGSSSPDALQRANREVDLLGSHASPFVVRAASDLIEIGQTEAVAWLEEYLDGEDLSQLLGSPWGWRETAHMMTDVAQGLAALHSESIVHRDLSANNVRRVSKGTYKILDPGFARHILRSGLTIGGQPGTPGFLTPEHLNVHSGRLCPAQTSLVSGF